MKYANWATEKELKEILKTINKDTKLEKSGFPILYDKKNLYITKNETNTLVIGSAGSGKTQSVVLPLTKLSILAKESLIINDVKGEIYEKTKEKLQENNYNIIRINCENPEKGNKWNPLTIPQKLYKEGNQDKALKMLEDIGFYLLADKQQSKSDPFWTNSCIDYFTGTALYLFESQKEEINLKNIYETAQILTKETLKEIDKTSATYINLVGTLNAPEETKGSIIATFNQKIKKYIQKEKFSAMIKTSDFDPIIINEEPTAVFIISETSNSSSNIIPLFINQLFDLKDISGTKDRITNILLDEFDELIPIKDFNKIIHYSRNLKIRFTVIIKSFLDLVNMYGQKDAELIKLCFSTLIYLMSNDISTLEEISKICGKKDENNSLITVEELRLLKTFEAIILMPRTNAVRTKLIPDYEINWDKN